MGNTTFKIGDRVKIINACAIDLCELNKVGIIVKIDDYADGENCVTYVVDMGRPRRIIEPEETCWWLNKNHIELASKPNEQLLFTFMKE